MKEINKEGLTFEEWWLAANAFGPIKISYLVAKKEWSKGVDPTEYASK